MKNMKTLTYWRKMTFLRVECFRELFLRLWPVNTTTLRCWPPLIDIYSLSPHKNKKINCDPSRWDVEIICQNTRLMSKKNSCTNRKQATPNWKCKFLTCCGHLTHDDYERWKDANLLFIFFECVRKRWSEKLVKREKSRKCLLLFHYWNIQHHQQELTTNRNQNKIVREWKVLHISSIFSHHRDCRKFSLHHFPSKLN